MLVKACVFHAPTSEREGRRERLPPADASVQLQHELLTPLAAIRALAEMLPDHPELSLEERRFFLERLLSERLRLEQRLAQWLDLRR